MSLSMTEAAREQRCRRAAIRDGCQVSRSRWHLGSIDNPGGYRVVDVNTNFVVLGTRWELSLDDVERWLAG